MCRVGAEVSKVFDLAEPAHRFILQECEAGIVQTDFVNGIRIENGGVAHLVLLRPRERYRGETRHFRGKNLGVGVQEVGIVKVIIPGPVAEMRRIQIKLHPELLIAQI